MVRERDGIQVVYATVFYYMELNTAKMLHDLNIKTDISENETNKISIISVSKYFIIALIVVVLPVPGPPVMINSPFLTASITARFCISSN